MVFRVQTLRLYTLRRILSARRKAVATPTPRNVVEEMIRMARGGARNRSGPQPDENSQKSDKVGFILTALPSEGFAGKVPDFPLETPTDREVEVWAQAWALPQACAWSMESWRWRAVAMWVRYSVRMEDLEASAALANVVVRFADQIGLTPAGLKENGWKIAADVVAAKHNTPRAVKSSAKSRLTVVSDASGA